MKGTEMLGIENNILDLTQSTMGEVSVIHSYTKIVDVGNKRWEIRVQASSYCGEMRVG